MLKSLFTSSKQKGNEYHQFLLKLVIILWFALLLWFIYSIIHIVLAFFVAAFLVMLFSPFLNWCNRHKIADWLWIIIVYLVLIAVVTLIFVAIIPIFVEQISGLIQLIARWFDGVEKAYATWGIQALWLPAFISDYLLDIDWKDLFWFVR